MKRLYFFVLVLSGLLFCANTNLFAQQVGNTFEYGGLWFKITSVATNNRTVGVTIKNGHSVTLPNGQIDVYTQQNIVIPNEVPYQGNSYKVTEVIGGNNTGAFYYCKNLKSVVLGDYVEVIGPSSFQNTMALDEVDFNNAKEIKEMAFLQSGIKSVNLKNVTTIENMAFSTCRFLLTAEGDHVKSINNRTFRDCSSLTSVRFPNVENIESFCFLNCYNLADVNLSDAPDIGRSAFNNTKWRDNQPNGPLYLNNTLYEYKGDIPSPGEVVVKDGTKKISEGAFAFKDGLTSINIKNVESIGNGAFNSCYNLGNITIWTKVPPTLRGNLGDGVDNRKGQININIPLDSQEAYLADPYWRGFLLTEIKTPIYEIFDGKDEYTNEVQYDFDEIRYTRNFKHNKWQPLYVPFSMQYDEWKDNFEIARLNNIHQYDDDYDGVVDRTSVEIIREKNQTQPNMPYVIRAKNPGVYTLKITNATVVPAESTQLTCASITTLFTFIGTYTRYSGEGHYVVGGGALRPAADRQSGPGPFRWYANIETRTSQAMYTPKFVPFFLEDEDEMTGVEVQEIEPMPQTFDVYNLKGQLVKKGAKDLQGLRKGIYIVNGRKVIL